jgi:hypothetical protein
LRRFFVRSRRLGLFDGPQTTDFSMDVDQLTSPGLELAELADLPLRFANDRLRRQVLRNGFTADLLGELCLGAVSGVVGLGAMTPRFPQVREALVLEPGWKSPSSEICRRIADLSSTNAESGSGLEPPFS